MKFYTEEEILDKHIGKKGKRSGYGYEYEQAVAGTGLGMPIVKNSLM